MGARQVSAALTHRLGYEATDGLVELLDSEKEHVLNLAAERFDRRLTEEVSVLRVEIIRELHATRVDLFKWSFLFWIGQVAAVIGILTFMLRNRP